MGASAWIAHVKAYHKKHGGTYAAALKAAAKTWKKKGSAKDVGDVPKKKVRRRKK